MPAVNGEPFRNRISKSCRPSTYDVQPVLIQRAVWCAENTALVW